MTMQNTAESRIRDHYDAQSMRPATLEELTALATPRWERAVLPAAIAAIVLVAVSLASSMADLTRSDLTGAIGAEIATNHRRDLDPEFRSSDIAVIAQHMDHLDFDLRAATSIAERGLQVVGARYCSVQGRIAAQLRLADGGTLYVVRAFGRVREGTQPHDDILVELWREGDLLIGLAGDR